MHTAGCASCCVLSCCALSLLTLRCLSVEDWRALLISDSSTMLSAAGLLRALQDWLINRHDTHPERSTEFNQLVCAQALHHRAMAACCCFNSQSTMFNFAAQQCWQLFCFLLCSVGSCLVITGSFIWEVSQGRHITSQTRSRLHQL